MVDRHAGNLRGMIVEMGSRPLRETSITEIFSITMFTHGGSWRNWTFGPFGPFGPFGFRELVVTVLVRKSCK